MAHLMQSQYQKGGREVRKVKRQLLKVLYATDMPSVLTELGFMTNKSELAYMSSEKGQNAYARMLCNAVKEYVGHINKLSGVDTRIVAHEQEQVQTAEPKSEPQTIVEETALPVKQEQKREELQREPEAAAKDEGYAIQLLASDKIVKSSDAQFKSYKG